MRRALVALALLLVPSVARAEPLRARAFGGVTHGSLFDLPVTGPTGGAGFGGGIRRSWGGVDGFADVAYDALSTPHDVGVHRLAIGGTAELILWHFRVGAGVDVGAAWFARLSGSEESARRVFIGVHATLGVDLFTVGGFTPFVQGRVAYDTAFPSFGASAGLRYAF